MIRYEFKVSVNFNLSVCEIILFGIIFFCFDSVLRKGLGYGLKRYKLFYLLRVEKEEVQFFVKVILLGVKIYVEWEQCGCMCMCLFYMCFG